MPSDEQTVSGAVVMTVIEDRARPEQVDAIAIVAAHREVRHGRHVNHGFGAVLAKDVLGGALADVELEHFDPARWIAPRTPIDADHRVPRVEQPERHQPRELPGNPRNQHLHAPAPLPCSIN